MTPDTTTAGLLPLVRLLQMASPALPIGAYSYSQGLEWMIDSRAIRDGASAQQWIADVLVHVLAEGEAAVLWRLLDARVRGDRDAFVRWSNWYRASRETRELRAETDQMGASLLDLSRAIDILDSESRSFADDVLPIPLPAAFAIAAHAFAIDPRAAVAAFLMSWVENQVLAAVKTLPLGQVGGQRMLLAIAQHIPAVVARACTVDDGDVSSFAPGLAFASARHEAQYSRLFRS